jgi:molybdate transport system regulatory protein
MAAVKIRFRVDLDSRCSVGIGKIELLEGVARTGSISQAAREMQMSYRRAWLLLNDVNVGFDRPVVRASPGGRRGGGAILTDFGKSLVAAYRELETEIHSLAASRLRSLSRHVKPGGGESGDGPRL